MPSLVLPELFDQKKKEGYVVGHDDYFLLDSIACFT